jgi:hypothetical protein
MGALGRVELPTNGCRIKYLQGGFRCHIREKSSHSALICQRICQRYSCIVSIERSGIFKRREKLPPVDYFTERLFHGAFTHELC